MIKVFIHVIKLSLITSLPILFFYCLSHFRKERINHRWSYIGGTLLLAILVIPIQFEVNSNVRVTSSQVIINRMNMSENISRIVKPVLLSSEVNAVSLTMSFGDLLLLVWIIGVVGYLLYNAFIYVKFISLVKRYSSHIKDEELLVNLNNEKLVTGVKRPVLIYLSEVIVSPMIIGIFKPTIYLPHMYEHIDIQYVLRHELLHLKRNDILLKLIITIIKSIYWFNPFVHLLGKMMNEVMELCCDEDVMKLSSDNNGIPYSETLLYMMKNIKNNVNPNVSQFIGGRKFMKHRIENILNIQAKKSGLLLTLLIVTLTLSVTVFMGCSVVSSQQNNTNENTEANDTSKEENEIIAQTSDEIEITDVTLNVIESFASEKNRDEDIESAVNQTHFADYDEIPSYRYFYNYINLDEDEELELMVYLIGMAFSGSGGSTLDIYDVVGNKLEYVHTMNLVHTPIYINDSMTNGWFDIILYVSGGGIEGNYRIIKNGEGYPLNPSIEDILPIDNYNVKEIINDEITAENGLRNE